MLVVAAQDGELQGIRAPEPAGPSPAPSAGCRDRAGEILREREGRRRIRSRLHLASGAQTQQRSGRGRLRPPGRLGGAGMAGRRPGFSVLWRAGRRGKARGLGAPAAACAGQATVIQLPAPRQAGEAERLVAAAVKAKGFSLFPGIAGKCSLPMAGSPASGVGEGSGMPSAEAESTLQDPGRAGGTRRREWRQTSHSVSSFILHLLSTHCMPGILPGTGATRRDKMHVHHTR